MPQLISLIVYDPAKVDAVMRAWVRIGVTGLTMLDSSGLYRLIAREGTPEDIPLFPSLRKMLEGTERQNRLMMSVVPDGFDVDGLIAETETILGRLEDPGSGILWVVPVSRVVGLRANQEV
jgi:nitrogen regulatory protein P-II 1